MPKAPRLRSRSSLQISDNPMEARSRVQALVEECLVHAEATEAITMARRQVAPASLMLRRAHSVTRLPVPKAIPNGRTWRSDGQSQQKRRQNEQRPR